MKNLFILLFILLFFTTCGKIEQQQHKFGGALPDLPNKVSVITSKGFVKNNTDNVISRGKQDKSAPSVYFLSPTGGSSVSGIVRISISATDNVGVTSISISINGNVVSKSNSYSWDTNNLPSGIYYLSATASDAVGNTRTVTINVTINTIVVDPIDNLYTQVSIKMPTPMNQGSEGSCVAFAVGYAARSADLYYKTGASSYNISTNVFSPEFLYNQIKFSTDCNSGTAMQTGLDFMLNNGICTWATMPYSSTNGCSLLPNLYQQTEALNYKIEGYYKIYTSDIAMIKSMLDNNKPVIINVIADNSFINAKPGFVWRTYSGSGSLPHCIVICGYDDSKNAYKIMNSWGTTWGIMDFL